MTQRIYTHDFSITIYPDKRGIELKKMLKDVGLGDASVLADKDNVVLTFKREAKSRGAAIQSVIEVLEGLGVQYRHVSA